jgi:hypothetical protein
MSVTERSVCCSLSEEQLRERRKELRAGLVREIRDSRDLADGVEFRFDANGENDVALREFIRVEEGCCGFATYTTRREDDALWLEIRGPEGTREMFAPMAPGERALKG